MKPYHVYGSRGYGMARQCSLGRSNCKPREVAGVAPTKPPPPQAPASLETTAQVAPQHHPRKAKLQVDSSLMAAASSRRKPWIDEEPSEATEP
jgi:hypothetical protein